MQAESAIADNKAVNPHQTFVATLLSYFSMLSVPGLSKRTFFEDFM